MIMNENRLNVEYFSETLHLLRGNISINLKGKK